MSFDGSYFFDAIDYFKTLLKKSILFVSLKMVKFFYLFSLISKNNYSILSSKAVWTYGKREIVLLTIPKFTTFWQ